MDTSAKYRNVGINPNVAFVVDDAVSEEAAGMRFVEVRGLGHAGVGRAGTDDGCEPAHHPHPSSAGDQHEH